MTLPRRARWYEALPETTATIDCGGEEHRVSWRRGKLVLEDHDLGAERTMLVFGGEQCACMQVLKMWGDQFSMPPEFFTQMQTWLGAKAFLAPKELELMRQMGMVLSWERAWRKGAYLGKHERMLEPELKERAASPLKKHLLHWKQATGARMVTAAEIKLIRSDHVPHLTGSMDRFAIRARATLKGTWPVEVWGRGVAVIGDAFVLEVTKSRRPELEVRAARWEDTGSGWLPSEGTATAVPDGGGGWSLTWHDDGSNRRMS